MTTLRTVLYGFLFLALTVFAGFWNWPMTPAEEEVIEGVFHAMGYPAMALERRTSSLVFP